MGKWEMVQLGDIFDLQMGKTPSRDNAAYWNDGIYKWISIADIGQANKYITDTKETITQDAIQETGIKLVPKNTVIMSFKLSLGKTAITSQDMYTNEAIMAFHNNGRYSADIDYLYHLFRWFPWGLNTNKAVMGATLNKATLSNIKIPLPPLDEQKRIAKNLDLASEIVKGYKEQLAELDKLVQSVFYEMFGDPVTNEKGWNIKPLKNIAVGKLSYGSGASAIPFDGNIRYLRITDVNENGQLNNDVVSPSKYDNKYVLHDGDILFARSGATVGKTFRYSDTYGKCLYAGYLIRLIPDRTLVLPDYIFSFTKSQYYRRFIEKNMKVVAQPNINAQQYGDLDICVPPLSLQTRFAGFVAEIEAQKAQIQQALTEAENLYNSLMQEYFE